MNLLLVTTILVAFTASVVQSWSPWHTTHMSPNRSVIVQMFEWRHDDIADECEQFLGPYGYGAVQVSPIGEHAVIDNGPGKIRQPWYQR